MPSLRIFVIYQIQATSQARASRAFYLAPVVALLLALAYIVRLQRELLVARQRGDMYRDIAASLDRQRAEAPGHET